MSQTSADDSERLRSLDETGLSNTLDDDLQRFARLGASILSAPVALVSLVEETRQVFPGMVGLPEPWAAERATPLSHSFCQHVVERREPLILTDARLDPLTCDNLAIPDLDVVGYAGMPLLDQDGRVLGSLCVIDNQPREWQPDEIALLADLAEACSTELQLRISVRRLAEANAEAERARAMESIAYREIDRDRQRAETVLRAVHVLGEATDLIDLRRRVRDLVVGPSAPSWVGFTLADDERLHRIPDPEVEYDLERRYAVYRIDQAWPTARAIAEQRTIVVNSEAQLVADGYGVEALEMWRSLDLSSLIVLPLAGAGRMLGALALGWDEPHALELTEEAVLSSIAGYAATAVERTLQLTQRVHAAVELQRSLLTEPAQIDGIEIATLYRPAPSADMVGGDWYDVHRLPAPAGETLVLTVGDITGHDMRAAAIMGQVRSMLRQAEVDAPLAGPAHAIDAVQAAAQVLGVPASGTAVHGHLRRVDGADWRLRWTNAGHPPPLALLPDGRRIVMSANDVLLHPDLRGAPRTDHDLDLPPGSVVLIYTDGLLDDWRTDIDTRVLEMGALLHAALHEQGLSLQDAVQQLADTLLGDHNDDDAAVLAFRVQ